MIRQKRNFEEIGLGEGERLAWERLPVCAECRKVFGIYNAPDRPREKARITPQTAPEAKDV